MILSKNQVYNVNYTKANGEVSTRDIIPITEAPKNIKALDLTGLDDNEKRYVIEKQKEYSEYVEQFLANMFTFDTWYEHVNGAKFPEQLLKYKTFTVENISPVEK